ncbi:DeoR/GlpR family DNA-binding transcription regulator [Lacticaseibacillus songhuajiangensis]|uniref:DeoR/GlpR family DNA-binding transcription regulator n=1 Tax=Lacticaseibacillus songhuajiangensis TaxID=1296539 RepID=UPI000F7AAE25|nr:DeoR/GlpR family DNA-binding transcription regulator [Lacticaseibacillus songhuajiangensis]MCI1283750.1 DeoR/GlpR family DNA-binding transcription regulator [Lacticaseibacillus songhuajiangensis]
MLTEERKRKILTELDKKSVVQLRKLTDMLDASESTIRRDLGELEKEGLLRRVHGGAEKTASLTAEAGVQEKATVHTAAKMAIARAAADMVNNGALIFLDAGTSTGAMIPLLRGKDITVVTTGVDNASMLADYGIKTILLGGSVKPLTKAVIGAEAVRSLGQYRFNIAFLGTNGVHAEYGCTTPDPEEAATKRVAAGQSAQAVVLADSSKFGAVSFAQVLPIQDALIITDDRRELDDSFTKLSNIKEAQF